MCTQKSQVFTKTLLATKMMAVNFDANNSL